MKKWSFLLVLPLAIMSLFSCAEEYTITYENLLGSTPNNPTSYTANDAFYFKKPSDNGYDFAGWRLNSSEGEVITNIERGTTGNLTLYATWGDPSFYRITYHNVNASEHNNPTTYTIETETFPLNAATRSGYKFYGWYKDKDFTQEIASIPKGSFGDVDVYARWVVSHTITYVNVEGVTHANPTTYTIEDNISLLDPIGVKTGYTTFDHWEIDGVRVDGWNAGERTGNLTITAVWSTPVKYSITYVLDHGDNNPENPENYTIEEEVTFKPASKDGCEFGGWYKDKDFTQEITSIPKGSTGDVKIYAQWFNVYTITWTNWDGTVLETDEGVRKDTMPSYDGNTPMKEDEGDYMYVFDGWYPKVSKVTEATVYKAVYLEVSTARTVISISIPEINDDYEFSFDYTSTSDIVVSWGDSSGEDNLSTHKYSAPGNYLIMIQNITSLSIHEKTGSNYVTDVYLGNTVTSIGDGAFQNSLSLTSIKIPNSVTSINSSAFADCPKLTTVTTTDDSQISTIDAYAFYNCPSLVSIKIPSSVTSIGLETFAYCPMLTTVTIPEDSKLYEIYNFAFAHCPSLVSIYFPSGVAIICNSSFRDCTSLRYINFSEDSHIVSIMSFAFDGCTSLNKIKLPKNVNEIVSSFNNCSNLSCVDLTEFTTPPKLVISPFKNCSSHLLFYVNPDKVDAFKSAPDWSEYADQVVAGPPPCIQ